MTRGLDLLLAFLLGAALAGAGAVFGDAPRWSAQSGLVLWTHATDGPMEASATRPVPVKGY